MTNAFAIFDISPDAVRLTLTEREAHAAKPRLLVAKQYPILPTATEAVFGVKHVEQLRKAFADIPHDLLPRIKSKVVLHAPFALTQLRAAGKTFTEPTLVTPELLDMVMDFGSDAFRPKTPSIRTERVAFLVRLNGYPVHVAKGKKAKEVAVSVYESYVSDEVYQKTVGIVGNTTGAWGGGFHTVPLTALPVVRDILRKGSDMTLIHAGTHATDIGIVRGGILSGIRSFGKGSRAFALELCNSLVSEYSEAESLVKLCFDGALASDSRESVERVRDEVRRRWLGELVGSDRPDTSTVLMPRHAVLFGDPIGVQLYGDLLSTENSRRGVLEGVTFNSDILSPQGLKQFVEVPASFSPDIYHLLSALAFTS